MKNDDDYIKANRKGSREAELENSTGFKSVHKIHLSKKRYKRKDKHKKRLLDNNSLFHLKFLYSFMIS